MIQSCARRGLKIPAKQRKIRRRCQRGVIFSTPKPKLFEFRTRSAICGCNRGQKINFISSAQHVHFQSISSSKTPDIYGRLLYLWIARCFEISSFNCCSAPDTHYRCARLIALSPSSDKLASGYRNRGIYALVLLSRAAFEFLTLAVRGSPMLTCRHVR